MARRLARWRGGYNLALVGVILLIQALSAVFFVSDILSSLIGLPTQPLDWQLREFIEIGAAVGLVIGFGLGATLLYRTTRRARVMEQQLRAASGAFMELLAERFAGWKLTPAERDVALFAIKGLSTHDIARLRNTSEGTVKAQSNAIYRKAGVSGRSQLLSLFIEDLMAESLPAMAAPEADPAPKPDARPVTAAGTGPVRPRSGKPQGGLYPASGL